MTATQGVSEMQNLLAEELLDIAQVTMMDYGNVSYEMERINSDSRYKLNIILVYKHGMKNMTSRVDFYLIQLKNAIFKLDIGEYVKVSVVGANDANDIVSASSGLPFSNIDSMLSDGV